MCCRYSTPTPSSASFFAAAPNSLLFLFSSSILHPISLMSRTRKVVSKKRRVMTAIDADVGVVAPSGSSLPTSPPNTAGVGVSCSTLLMLLNDPDASSVGEAEVHPFILFFFLQWAWTLPSLARGPHFPDCPSCLAWLQSSLCIPCWRGRGSRFYRGRSIGGDNIYPCLRGASYHVVVPWRPIERSVCSRQFCER
jgi:hypothetical protein